MAGGAQGVSSSQASQLANMLQGAGQSGGSTTAPSAMSNYASPNQNFMQYPQQGQPNQAPTQNIGATPQNQNFMQGADATGQSTGTDTGFFDNSGSDGGQGGQPAPMQSPFGPQGNKPPSLSQYSPQQGLQIQGNPTSQVVQRPQQR